MRLYLFAAIVCMHAAPFRAMETRYEETPEEARDNLYAIISEKLLDDQIALEDRLLYALLTARKTSDPFFYKEIAECIFCMPELKKNPTLIPLFARAESAHIHHARKSAKKWHSIIKFVLLAKADIDYNAQDSNGNTALILAAKQQHSNLYTSLIQIGALQEIKNKKGYLASDYWFLHAKPTEYMYQKKRRSSL